MTNFTVSVVIPAFNCEKTIGQAIAAVLAQSYPVTAIVVVDDGSTDQTAKIVQTFPQVKYVYQKNAGPAAARNHGAGEVKSHLVFFTDSDCIPQRNWIEKSVSHFQDEKVGAVAGSYGIANPQNLLARCIHKEIIYRHQHLMPVYPKAFGSYNVGIQKIIFDKVGGFDAGYQSASGEDNDLSYKILKVGYKIYFEKDSLVDHFHTTRLKKYLWEQYRHGFWRVKMYQDHPQMMTGDNYTFWKDMIEVPLATLIAMNLMLALISFNLFLSTAVVLALFLFGLELFFSFFMTNKISEIIFLSFTMFLRSFFRTFGFSSGILRFLSKKKQKEFK